MTSKQRTGSPRRYRRRDILSIAASAPIKTPRSPSESRSERVEVRIPVEIIFPFGDLQSVDGRVRNRRHQCLDGHFEEVVCQDKRNKEAPWKDAEEGRHCYENAGVHQFAKDRASDRARPQPAALGE